MTDERLLIPRFYRRRRWTLLALLSITTIAVTSSVVQIVLQLARHDSLSPIGLLLFVVLAAALFVVCAALDRLNGNRNRAERLALLRAAAAGRLDDATHADTQEEQK